VAQSLSDPKLAGRVKAHLARYQAYQPLRDPLDEGTL